MVQLGKSLLQVTSSSAQTQSLECEGNFHILFFSFFFFYSFAQKSEQNPSHGVVHLVLPAPVWMPDQVSLRQ